MLIAQISDTHILVPGSDHPAAQLRADCLRRCVADINRQRPDAVIFTGDTVQHGLAEEYAHLRALLAPLEAPLYLIPGNRDDKEAMRAAFGDRTYLPKNGAFLHYAVDDHALRLVGIDSTSPGERKGVFCAARQAWLDAALGEEPDRPTMLFIHHPPFDVDDHYVGGYRRPEDAAALTALVSRHAQVERLFCGHVHCLAERSWAGTLGSVMPSIAVDVRKGVDEAEAAQRPIYMLHRRSEAGGFVSEPRRVEPVS
jgi:3',5'-cyclic AMP phosphodiesterase CpdA